MVSIVLFILTPVIACSSFKIFIFFWIWRKVSLKRKISSNDVVRVCEGVDES